MKIQDLKEAKVTAYDLIEAERYDLLATMDMVSVKEAFKKYVETVMKDVPSNKDPVLSYVSAYRIKGTLRVEIYINLIGGTSEIILDEDGWKVELVVDYSLVSRSDEETLHEAVRSSILELNALIVEADDARYQRELDESKIDTDKAIRALRRGERLPLWMLRLLMERKRAVTTESLGRWLTSRTVGNRILINNSTADLPVHVEHLLDDAVQKMSAGIMMYSQPDYRRMEDIDMFVELDVDEKLNAYLATINVGSTNVSVRRFEDVFEGMEAYLELLEQYYDWD